MIPYTYSEAPGGGWDVYHYGAWEGWSAGSLADAKAMVAAWEAEATP